jgi:hypothetical protein
MTTKDYALRRILYYMMIVSRSVKTLGNKECDYAAREAVKCGALISLRALSAFLTDDHVFKDGSRVYPDDALVVDFGLGHRQGLSRGEKGDRSRINKLFAHAVNVKQKVYRDPEVCDIAPPVLQECAGFVRDCRDKKLAKLTGNAPKYLRIVADLWPSLKLPAADEW